MPMAHVCMGCGLDLARTPRRREPHYGLLVVTCPRCRRTATRSRPVLQSRWRRWRRLHASIGTLSLCLLVLSLCAATQLSIVFAAADGDRPAFLSGGGRGFEALRLLLVGMGLTVCLAHWTWWRRLAAWAALLFAVAVVAEYVRLLIAMDAVAGPLRGAREYAVSAGWRLALHSALIVAMTLVTIVGIPFGLGFRRVVVRGRRWRRRRLRAKMHRRVRT